MCSMLNGIAMMSAIGLFWILALVAIVLVVIWLVRGFGAGRSKPLEVLKERFARGEIGKDEFEAMKRELST